MAVSLKHAFTSAIADGGDSTLVQPSNWNAEHTLTLASGFMLGRSSAGTGSAEEITVGGNLILSGGTLDADVGLGANSFTAPQTISGGTVTADSPVLNLTQTWNNSGVTFNGIKLNVTDTASGTNSLLFDFQVATVSQFKLLKNGNLIVAAGAQLGAALNIQGDTYFGRKTAANWRFGQGDVAAPVAQTLSVQSVVAGTTNTAGANFTITGSQGTGTGVGGSIIFQVAPAGSTGTAQNALATALTIGTTAITAQNHLLFSADNTYDIGASGATRPRSIYSSSTVVFANSFAVNTGSNTVLWNASQLGWASTGTVTTTTALDTILTRRAAANIRLGAADAAAPVAQTLSIQSVVAGTTNTAGVNLTIDGSQGTGTGAGGAVIIRTAPAGTTGTAQNALSERIRVDSTGAIGIGGANYGTSGQSLVSGGASAAPSWSLVSLTAGVTGTLPVLNGGTGTTTSTGSGSVVLSTSPVLTTPNLGTPSAVTLTSATGLPLTTGVTGTLPAANGGTGQSTYAVGDILYASTTSALSKLADVATGSALISGGVGVAPSWGKVGLTTHVSGNLPLGNGGTNAALTAVNGGIVYSTGSAMAITAAGTTGQVLISNGAAAPTWGTASGGGAVNNIFWENNTTITTSYTITTSKNAGTFGPVTINSGVTVTVPSGSTWTIV